ncbi:unnamed protein product [Lymnaea stagnalis]|uniref:Uncharacterized protein n=1 Tax=Lymnaea stagnalis TaxID=6523 RepID=A0AAV2HEK2_LYMST
MKKLFSINARIILICFYFDLCKAEWTSVDKPYSFSCDYAKNVLDSITWQSQDLISKYKCSIYTMPQCDPADDNVSLYYEAKMTSNGSVYTSVFTIKSVPLLPYNTTWFCRVDLSDQTSFKIQYSLNGFAPPKTPTCDTVTVVDDINIQIHCFTEIVFPTAICDFYAITNETREEYLSTGLISYYNQPSIINGYKRTDCTYTVSACILGNGRHLFSVVMYPNITSYITDEMKRVGHYKDQMIIDFPDAPTIYSVTNEDKRIASKNVLLLYKGIAVIMCEYKGSFPIYKNIRLICGNVENYSLKKTDIDIVNLILNTSTLAENETCTCEAWRDDSNCPHKKVTVNLQIEQYQSQSKSCNEFKEAAIGLGFTAGILALILLVALTMFVIRRNKNKKKKSSKIVIQNNRGDYSDIHENPHKYELPVFKPSESSQEELTVTYASVHASVVETSFNRSPSLGFITTNTMANRKQVYSNEQDADYVPKDAYHHYDEAVAEYRNEENNVVEE